MPKPTLTARIRDRYASLRPAERRIADLILNFPGEIAGYTASELARMADTSNAAVSRFVQRVGFENFEEMRILARESKIAGSPLFQMDHLADPSVSGTLQRQLDATIAAMQITCAGLSDELIEDIATAIVSARRLWIIGFRHSYFLAAYFHWQMIHLRADAHLLPERGATFGETLADIGRGDLIVAFGMRRRPRMLESVLSTAIDQGARLLMIADLGFAQEIGASWTIRCDTRQLGPVDNHASAMLVCQLLIDRAIVKSGAAGRERFGRIDDLHEKLEEL
jgi:DNA-binding MurR/RpiR family transcriptional regulator